MRRPLDDAEVVRVKAVADVPTLQAWLELAHSRAGHYRAGVSPDYVLEFDIQVPVSDEPLIVNNAGHVEIHHAEAGKNVGVLLRFTLSAPGAKDVPCSVCGCDHRTRGA
jgi:hypothetical protein